VFSELCICHCLHCFMTLATAHLRRAPLPLVCLVLVGSLGEHVRRDGLAQCCIEHR
jgi:hypothetical protein